MGKVDNKKLIQLAAEAGAKAAMDHLEKERAKEQAERKDKRLHNTRLLLKNYRLFKKYTENAVYEAEQLDESVYDILELMERNSSNSFVNSIKNSVARTTTLVQHIDVMLGLYRVYCEQSGKVDSLRRWRVVNALYMDEPEKTVTEISEQEHVAERTIYRDMDAAFGDLAALFFGIDGVRRG